MRRGVNWLRDLLRTVVRNLAEGVSESGIVAVHGWQPVWFEWRERDYRPGAPLTAEESAAWRDLTRAFGPMES